MLPVSPLSVSSHPACAPGTCKCATERRFPVFLPLVSSRPACVPEMYENVPMAPLLVAFLPIVILKIARPLQSQLLLRRLYPLDSQQSFRRMCPLSLQHSHRRMCPLNPQHSRQRMCPLNPQHFRRRCAPQLFPRILQKFHRLHLPPWILQTFHRLHHLVCSAKDPACFPQPQL